MSWAAILLAILSGLIKVMPQVLELMSALRQHSEKVAAQKKANTALERFNEKRKATSEFIVSHTNAAIEQLQDTNASDTDAGKLRENKEAISKGE